MSRVAAMERAPETAQSLPLGSKLGVFVMALGLVVEPGPFQYDCSLHPNDMQGSVLVSATGQ